MPSPAFNTHVNIILLDIEGTTTPVDFVYKTLFPYASTKIESFLREHFRGQEIISLIEQLHRQYKDDKEKLQPPPWIDDNGESQLRSAVAYCQWLMSKDIKYTTLKYLQGKIISQFSSLCHVSLFLFHEHLWKFHQVHFEWGDSAF